MTGYILLYINDSAVSKQKKLSCLKEGHRTLATGGHLPVARIQKKALKYTATVAWIRILRTPF